MCLQLMDVAVKLPPFKAPKVAAVEYEAPQLLPLPELLDEEVQGLALDRLFGSFHACPRAYAYINKF